ncbi:phosphoenolpyruvate carboxykinase (ATP) [Spirosoma endophyticum]|uniref:Hpr(Ser) kinase/phosphatase n=1 Tax=Spirosoma endophyticum TaxID=662367 RepID=A0A1I1KWW4_9BACT|nr:serine kinase [Spirosoma endophyticum]SFC61910.1 hypothetical protein SAMN05216167_1024 [Spirosoma endophyticum]
MSKFYYTAYGLRIGSEISLPLLKEIQTDTVDLTVKFGNISEIPPLAPTKIHRAGLDAQFAQSDGRLWLDWSPIACFMAANGNELIVDTNQTDVKILSLFILSEALGLILFQNGYLLLHGSAIQLNNKGVVFVGEPGAGKSTTVAAFAQKGVSIISDDMVCIRIDEMGKPSLIPAFPQIKIWEKSVEGLQLSKNDLNVLRTGSTKFSWHESVSFEEAAVPLEQIFILSPPKGENTEISQLDKSEGPVALLSYFPLPDLLLRGGQLKDHFEKSVTIAQTTPIFRMSRPADFAKLYAFVDYMKTTI